MESYEEVLKGSGRFDTVWARFGKSLNEMAWIGWARFGEVWKGLTVLDKIWGALKSRAKV